MALTKKDIVESTCLTLALPKNKTNECIETLLEIIKRTLENGEDVLISGFGKFCVKDKRARKGRNPQTDQDIQLEARRVVTFRCSGNLKDKINGTGRFGPPSF